MLYHRAIGDITSLAVFLFTYTSIKMKKEELFDTVIGVVSECTGIGREEILRCKSEECTDVRCIAVQVLGRYLTDAQIARLMGLTSRGVNYIRGTFLLRSKKWFVRSNYEAVVKRIGSNALMAV